MTLSSDEKAVMKVAEALEGLVKHPGWQVYKDILEARIRAAEEIVLTTCNTLNEAMEQNAYKGQVIALRLALELPHATMSQAREIRLEHRDE